MAKKFPIIVLTGPRQSGKTTLAKALFNKYEYVNLENPDVGLFATNDPRGFLKLYNKYVIIDEAQKVPELFSYLQQKVDDDNIEGQYILSGSQNFLLSQKIAQTLAGRVYVMELLPLNQYELKGAKIKDFAQAIITGSYPRIYDKGIQPNDFYPSYIKTYIEKDVRDILNVQNLAVFQKFISVLAHYAGQLFNANSLSKELGIDAKTVQSWLSILETSYIAFTLPVWHKNFKKRLIKTPKLYFYDTGLLAYLLGISSSKDFMISQYKGALFENFGIIEIIKNNKNRGNNNNYYFWRDSNGNEIDLIIEKGEQVKLIEMKASETVKSDYLKSLHYIDALNDNLALSHFLFNSSQKTQKRTNETIVAWDDATTI
ncbi:MAG: ATP-binding protein [Bacteroidetes bacterium]|nr:ATP-binding protein [Bacteroidota bacterium]MCB9226423.1 ATP-binding protein [Chitinophagales bacterium]